MMSGAAADRAVGDRGDDMRERAQANGEPGAVAICSSHEAAMAAAEAAAPTAPTSLAVHLGLEKAIGVVRATGDADALAEAMAPSADVGLHRTASRRLIRHRRTWGLGEPTPGITLLYFTRARPGLSSDDYHRQWERSHGPKALRHHLGMWDYTQVSATQALHGAGVDGFAVTLWARPEELADRFTDGPTGTAVIQEDARQFTDLADLERHLMDERVLVEAPWVTPGSVVITDARELELDCPADVVWDLVGRFGAIDDWWPAGPRGVTTTSELGVGMARTLTLPDGTRAVERLFDLRPEERMLQLAIDEGLPPGVEGYTSRYEVRALGDDRCRLDWFPRATVDAAAVDVFGGLVDRGWAMVAEGVRAAVALG
jgi:hypothetical protein